jgi:WD40 repeat protein
MKKTFLFFLMLTFSFAADAATAPAIWSIDTRAEVLKGEAKGVSVTETGAIMLAPRLSQIFNTEQSYVWSSAFDSARNVYLGTGGDGKIFKVDAGGNGALFTDTNELNVSALAIGKSGELYAGTSPDGKVYRISPNGNAEIFFEPKEKYIWSLVVLSDGSLAIGTGENGRIYKVRTANAKPEASLFFDTSETHIISLAADNRGNLYAGTDANGLVLRFASDGKPFALLDSSLREIHGVAVGADGSVYVLALSDSASASKTTSTAVGASADASTAAAAAAASAETPSAEPPQKSRYDLSGSKSVVYRILPDGGNNIIWNSANVTAFSIAANPNGNGVFLGTSDKGRVYSVGNDGREILLLQSNEGQISTLLNQGNRVLATSSNQGKLYRFGAETESEGTYESTVLNAKASATWGRIWWRSSGNVALQTRSGNTEKPNETWSDWSNGYTDQKGAQISSPKAKYLQWRAVLKSQTGASMLNEVNVSYLAQNLAPEVLSIQILPIGVGLLSSPPIQIDPNIENSGLDPSLFGFPNTAIPARRVYQRGARALQWTAEDRNGDRLEYDVYYREVNETNFELLRENQRDNFFTIDGSTLSDGRYIFRIVAKDTPSNPVGLSLSGDKLSEPFDIDNTPPTVSALRAPQTTGDRTRISFEANDAASFLTRAEYSVNGGDWQEVFADDGISDSSKERYTIEIPLRAAGEYTITLRVFDVNGNVGSARVKAGK